MGKSAVLKSIFFGGFPVMLRWLDLHILNQNIFLRHMAFLKFGNVPAKFGLRCHCCRGKQIKLESFLWTEPLAEQICFQAFKNVRHIIDSPVWLV